VQEVPGSNPARGNGTLSKTGNLGLGFIPAQLDDPQSLIGQWDDPQSLTGHNFAAV